MMFRFRRTEPSDDEICEAVLALIQAIRDDQRPPLPNPPEPGGVWSPEYDRIVGR